MSEEEGKLVFVYLHSPDHPFTAAFCRDTLCSEVMAPFLDANFVCWAGIQSRGEGQQVAAVLRPESFPFCAVVAPASEDNIAVLQQVKIYSFITLSTFVIDKHLWWVPDLIDARHLFAF